jgi:hypothetical protein
MSILDDTVIVIPSKRPAPIKTLISFPTDHRVIVISDPSRFNEHREWVENIGRKNVSVQLGDVGMIPQSSLCYSICHDAGFPFYFRMDDDLHPMTFVHKDGGNCTLVDAMLSVRACAQAFPDLSLFGFVNSSVRIWMKEGYGRSYGLIHGGCHLAKTHQNRWEYLDPELPAYEDVYRSAAHRERHGAVGRVNFIGLDKRASLRESSMSKTPEVIAKAKEIILKRFSDTVTCNGERVLDDGRQIIPNWRLVPGPWWVK